MVITPEESTYVLQFQGQTVLFAVLFIDISVSVHVTVGSTNY